jgi:protein-disulfide isomerase
MVSKEQAAIGKSEKVYVRRAAAAPLTVEEFGDFQCPPRGALSEPLNQLERDYHNKIRLVFRNSPVANHQYAGEGWPGASPSF